MAFLRLGRAVPGAPWEVSVSPLRLAPALLLAAVLLSVACARPAPLPAPAPAAPVPIPLGEAGSEPLSFRRVVYRIPTNSVIGEVRVGSTQREEMRWTVSRSQSMTFNVAVTDGLRRLGYDVRDEADALFDPNGSARVRYEMAAILHAADVDFRYRLNRSRDAAGEGVGTADVEVEVRLYDTLAKQTVYERRFRGSGRDEGTRPNPLMSAVVSAILETTADPDFVALLAVDPEVAGLARARPPTLRLSPCAAPEAARLPDDLPAALASVVEIRAGSIGGTGVIISPDGWVLTAGHVVRDAPEVWVRIDAGPQLPAAIHQSEPAADLALLQIPGRDHPCSPMREASVSLDLGSDVFAVNVSVDEGGRPTVTRGVVSGFPVRDGQRLIQTDASINPGSSGGPLLASDGSVAGITVMKLVSRDVEGVGFAVPAAEAIRRLGVELRDE